MKIKVSNVCQLVDKSKFTASGTTNGITWVSNGDGSITLNGTCTSGFALNPFNQQIPVDQTHFYYSSPYVSINYGGAIDGTYETGRIGYVKASAFPTKFNTVFYIWIAEGKSFSNVTTFINIDDLTEMYGAGNEPKTLAEFRKDFPNEMYEYSPECWKRCKELKYVTETKNLFDISKADVVIHSDMSFSSNVSYNSHFYSIPVEAGQTYTVSYDTYAIEGGGTQIALSCQTGDFYRDGVSLVVQLTPDHSINNWKHITHTFTIPSGATKITFSSLKYPEYPKYFRNFQLELGSTATPYQPYGYLPLRTGRYRTETRNLFDINANSEKGYYDEQGNFYPNDRFLCFTIDVISNNTYCISTSKLGSIKGIVSFWNNNTFVSAVNYGEQTAFAYTVPSGANKLKFVIEADQKYSNIQIELGTTATSYQPYKHIYFH